VVSHRFAVFKSTPVSVCNGAREFKLPWDYCPCEIAFADEVRDNVNVFTVDHVENLSQTRFLFPKGAMDFTETALP
jgi:hypothetical protein